MRDRFEPCHAHRRANRLASETTIDEGLGADGPHRLEAFAQVRALRVIVVLAPEPPALVGLAGQREHAHPLRAPDRVQRLDQLQHRRRAQLEGAVRLEVMPADQPRHRREFGRRLVAHRHRIDQRQAGELVAQVPGQLVARRDPLAEVVQQRRPADQGVAGCQPRRHVRDHLLVQPGVDLGVELRPLRRAVQAVDLGQQNGQRAGVAQHPQENARPRAFECLAQLHEHSLRHQMFEFA